MSYAWRALFRALRCANRLVTGGAVIGPGNKAETAQAQGRGAIAKLWPQIGQVNFDYVWNGYVG